MHGQSSVELGTLAINFRGVKNVSAYVCILCVYVHVKYDSYFSIKKNGSQNYLEIGLKILSEVLFRPSLKYFTIVCINQFLATILSKLWSEEFGSSEHGHYLRSWLAQKSESQSV